jgi:hypothetical protein
VRALIALVLSTGASLTAVITGAPSSAEAPCGTSTGANSSNFHTSITCSVNTGGSDFDPAGSTRPEGNWVTTVVCEATSQGGCVRQKRCPNGKGMTLTYWETTDGQRLDSHDNCSDRPPPSLGPTQADIFRAFKQIPLPESVLNIQPPGGATLVNFDTNFFTVAKPFEPTVSLLGHQVHFRIRPSSFTWHYGDGHDETTAKPGAAYPALDVTHRYLNKGTVTPSVDTVWEADYQVDGGGWAPVNGTVTKAGAAQRLTIKSATPVLVGSGDMR